MTPRVLLFTAALFIAAMLPSVSAAEPFTATVTCKFELRKGPKFKGKVCAPTTGTASGNTEVSACQFARNKAFAAADESCFKSPKKCDCTATQAEQDKAKRSATDEEAHPKGKAYLPDFGRKYANDWPTEKEKAEYAKNDEARQGFPGVFDPMTGDIFVRPSPFKSGKAPPNEFDYKTSKKTDKTTWVKRGGGHEQLAMALDENFKDDAESNAGTDRKKMIRAFTLIRDGKDGYIIEWWSTGVNNLIPTPKGGQNPDSALPTDLRKDVLDALAHHTDLTIREKK